MRCAGAFGLLVDMENLLVRAWIRRFTSTGLSGVGRVICTEVPFPVTGAHALDNPGL